VARQTVWLRRDPVGSQTRLPTQEAFRARHARSSLVAGAVAAFALTVLIVLRALPRWDGLWNALLAVAFCFGIAGIGAAGIALRARRLRPLAFAGLGVSLGSFVGALFVDRLVDLANG
jgi:hypothetical protein